MRRIYGLMIEQNTLQNITEQKIQLGDWEVRILPFEKVFSKGLQQQGLEIIRQWENAWRLAVPHEETWIRRHFDIPGLIVRIDATVEDGRLIPYEVEERPAGIGLATEINPDFARHFEEISSTWPPITSVLSHRRSSTDDSRIRTVVSPKEIDGINTLLLVRAAGKEEDYHSLSPRAVGTVKEAGNKRYGEVLGWWERIEPGDELYFDKAFVLKPLQGAMGQDIMLWHPENPENSASQEEIKHAVRNSIGRYIQEFHPPMESNIENLPHMIYRTYFGYNMQKNIWEALGGFWCISDKPIVDGGKDTVYAPLVLEN